VTLFPKEADKLRTASAQRKQPHHATAQH